MYLGNTKGPRRESCSVIFQLQLHAPINCSLAYWSYMQAAGLVRTGLCPRLVRRVLLYVTVLSSVCWSAPAATSTSLAVLPGNSVAERMILTFTATVSAGGNPAGTGLVKFCDMQTAIYCEDGTLLGSVWLAKNGTATLRMPLSFGSHKIQAVFQGTSAYGASSSAPAVVNVSTGSASTNTSITSSQYYGYGGLYQVQAAITGAPVPAISGTLAFLDGSNGNFNLGSVSVGSSSLNFTPLASVGGASLQQPQYTAVGDFNGDGKLDFVVASNVANAAQVFLGKGDGTFTPSANLTTNGSNGMLTADFNGDGLLDIAILEVSTISVYAGRGDGTFTLASTTSTGDWGYSFAIGDFNEDGIPDFAVTENYINSVQLLTGNGDGSFKPGASYRTGNNPEGIVATDFNRDGYIDLAFVNQVDKTATLLFGGANGTFTTGPTISLPASPYTLAAGDFNGDGIPDLAISAQLSGGEIFLGAGDGTFTQIAALTCGPSGAGYGIETSDFNQDGKTDLLVGGTIFLGDGTGKFSLLTYVGGNGSPVSIGDVNSDGSPDLLTPVYSSYSPYNGNVYVSLSQAAAPVSVAPLRVLGPGAHSVFASYGGDALHAPSQSSALAMAGAKISTSLSLDIYPGTTVSTGVNTQFVAKVSPQSIGAYVATGTMTFKDGATVLGTGSVSSGQASLSTNTLVTGSHTISVSYSGDTNFLSSNSPSKIVNVSGATTPTITWPTPVAISYGTALTTTQLNASSGGVAGTFVYTPAAGTMLSAGTKTLSVTFTPTDTSMYTSATTTVQLVVNKAALNVIVNNAVMTYGGIVPTFTAKYSGFLNGDTSAVLTGTPALNAGVTATSPAGTYTITGSEGNLAAANYSFVFFNGMLTIDRATLIVSANNDTKTYGQSKSYGPGSTAFTSNGLQNSETIGSVTITASGGSAANGAVGSYVLSPSAAVGGTFTATNYSVTYVNGTLTVNKAPLTITANDQTKTYGNTFNFTNLMFTAAGLQNGETVGAVSESSTGADASAPVSGSPYGILPTNARGGTFLASNYTITYVPGWLTITTRFTSTAINKDAPDPSKRGTPFTVTVTVTTSYATAAGTVSVALADPANTTCTVTLSAGRGSCTMTPPASDPNDTYRLTATYPGDGNYSPSTSPSVNHHVN